MNVGPDFGLCGTRAKHNPTAGRAWCYVAQVQPKGKPDQAKQDTYLALHATELLDQGLLALKDLSIPSNKGKDPTTVSSEIVGGHVHLRRSGPTKDGRGSYTAVDSVNIQVRLASSLSPKAKKILSDYMKQYPAIFSSPSTKGEFCPEDWVVEEPRTFGVEAASTVALAAQPSVKRRPSVKSGPVTKKVMKTKAMKQ
jgi:hypothetical protein